MNLVHWLQEAKRIHGICPCCGEVFRLSDALIYIDGPPPETEFDRVRDERRQHQSLVAQFEQEREAIRTEEVLAGAQEAHEQLVTIAPSFVGRGVDPEDVRVLFDPVRYIAFRGLNAGGITSVEFIDDAPQSAQREALLRSLDNALKNGNIEWKTWRVGADGAVSEML